MTEERILRVTDFEGYDYAALPAWFKLRLISDDPAPPKDWKPFCFDEYTSADDDFCPGVHQTNWMGYIQPELEENCVECIHRKKKEYEK